MDAALNKAVERYPWLTDITLANGDEPVQPKPRTGGTGAGKPSKNTAARTSLEQRFPALKGRRPH